MRFIKSSEKLHVSKNILVMLLVSFKEGVLISGFGKLCVKRKDMRKSRNPATGDDLIIGPRKVVAFKCSGILREKIDEK